jgi:DNA-binding NtrC family response regulator
MKSSAEKESILVVDDALFTLEVLQRNLASQKYKVFTADNVASAVNILDTTPIDLVITDLKMPGASGLDLIRHVRQNYKNTEVMMITGYINYIYAEPVRNTAGNPIVLTGVLSVNLKPCEGF